MKLLSSIVLLGLAVVAGCSKDKSGEGGGGGGGKVASCNVDTLFTCREYRDGNLAMGTKSLQELCTTLVSSAKFTETPCPIAKVIGTCKKPEGKDFFYEGYAGGSLEESCTQGGGTFATK